MQILLISLSVRQCLMPSLLRIARFVTPLLLASTWWMAVAVHAAGGHHAVDDAGLVEPGRCQLEVWADRYGAASRGVVHVGTACRLGAFELGANLDRSSASGESSSVAYGVQAKWVRSIADSLTGGVLVAATWQGTAPRSFVGASVILPLTWQATDTLQMHANLGRDFRNSAAHTNRAGVALEWSPSSEWSFIAERYQESKSNFWRTGARYTINANLSVDLTHASDIRRGDGAASAWWTLGVNWAFDR